MDKNTHMLMKPVIVLFLIFFLTISVSSEGRSDGAESAFFDQLIDFLYANYPDYMARILAYNGTNLGTHVSILQHNMYSGNVLETKLSSGYGVLLTNAFTNTLRNGVLESSKRSHTVLYKCQTAFHYCSGNPAYCYYHEGERGTKVIVVAGHDGPLIPKSIPDRVAGCWVPLSKSCIFKHNCEDRTRNITKDTHRCSTKDFDDMKTTDVAARIVDHLKTLTGKQPHFIVNRLHRSKVDVNRDIEKGTYYVAEAVQVWLDFQNFIRVAKETFNGKWGLILDIHGNSVPENWTMLGYGVPSKKIDMGQFSAYDTSLGSLARHVNVPFQAIFNGNNSLGYFMERENITACPSLKNAYPLGRNYFTGDYIIKHHGSKNGGNVDAVQIEIPAISRSVKGREKYASAVAQSIVNFIDVNYYKYGEVK